MIIVLAFIFFLNILPLIYGFSSSLIYDNSFTLKIFLSTLKAKYFYLSLFISLLYALFSSILSTYISIYTAKIFKKIYFPFLIIGWIIPPYIGVPIFRSFLEKYTSFNTNPIFSFFFSVFITSWFLIPFSTFFIYSHIQNINKKYFEVFQLDSNNISLYYNHIVIPNIKGAISSILFLNFISAFKDFQVPWLLLEGGAPMKIGITFKGVIGATTNLEVLIYKFFYQNIDSAYIGSIFTITIIILTIMYSLRKRVKVSFKITFSNKLLTYLWLFTIFIFLIILISLSFFTSPSIYIKGNFTLENFRIIFHPTFYQALLNTIIISVFSAFCGIILSTFFAFKLLSLHIGEKVLEFFNFSKIFFGLHSLIFIFYIFSKIHILNTYTSVILVIVSKNLPFLTLLSYYTFKSFPKGLYYIAKLDGLSDNKFFFKVLLANNFPLISSLFLLSFLSGFNAFLPPLLFLYDEKKYPLSLLLYNYVGTFSNHYPQWNIFAVISIVILLILTLVTTTLVKIMDLSQLKYY
ncbi:ABC transporter permease subunit [Thermosipho melanesiensis]|uniref:Binding-protein-dependent transport systems inner membrane component n=2 Tax=Thermosipho melanesiensis TaxID=46541 RepID=A6LJE1_THEM4|nr:binding-protein-dependent transport systems inner membrane component [Thermosipho melanesiensis BI429]APT73243.1 ABC transporter permease [Thermosipho melanesiensis]